MPFAFGLGRFLERLVRGGDVAGAFDAFTVHQLFDRAQLQLRVLLGVGLGMLIAPPV